MAKYSCKILACHLKTYRVYLILYAILTETDVMDESLPEEILLDENAEAEKHSFYMVGSFEVSPDQQLLAWAEDTVGGWCSSTSLRLPVLYKSKLRQHSCVEASKQL